MIYTEKHEIPLYDRQLIIVIGTEEEGDKFFSEKTNNCGHNSDDHYACAVMADYNKTGCQTLFLQLNDQYLKNGKIDEGLIAHECLHLVDLVWESVGGRHHPDHSEPSCYLIQFFVNLAHKAITNYDDRNSTTAR